jgi:hypothetical protein
MRTRSSIHAIRRTAPDAGLLPRRGRPDELGFALEPLGAAAMVIGRRYGLQPTSLWARVNVLTRSRLLTIRDPRQPAIWGAVLPGWRTASDHRVNAASTRAWATSREASATVGSWSIQEEMPAPS